MNSLVLLILVAAAVAGTASVHANSAYDTPAARFWEKTLPGTRMPEAIADLVQEGIDNPALKERRSAPYLLPSECLRYGVNCPRGSKAMPPGLFFRETQARVGSTMTVSFSPAILPRDAAKTVPFSNLADVLATFNIAPSSAEAEKIGNTLSACRTSVPGEKMMTCTTSVEATVESAVHMLLGAATTAGKNNDGVCHMTDERSKAYTMTLRGLQGGPTVTMAAFSHLDTSKWNPDHPAFEILHTKPGATPVCHFMPYAHLLFGEKAANA
ncbi:hypothetical protein QOZ80_6BG0500930 [Eleusine coracana subsp. coracana]|nr:hypothetical protein QOZ80_6BG0500930 [Eleusine coracana subsp. coracana]